MPQPLDDAADQPLIDDAGADIEDTSAPEDLMTDGEPIDDALDEPLDDAIGDPLIDAGGDLETESGETIELDP